MIENINKDIQTNLRKYNEELVDMNPQRILSWGFEKFENQFAITTSFGIQSSVLLDMVSKLSLQKKIKENKTKENKSKENKKSKKDKKKT